MNVINLLCCTKGCIEINVYKSSAAVVFFGNFVDVLPLFYSGEHTDPLHEHVMPNHGCIFFSGGYNWLEYGKALPFEKVQKTYLTPPTAQPLTVQNALYKTKKITAHP